MNVFLVQDFHMYVFMCMLCMYTYMYTLYVYVYVYVRCALLLACQLCLVHGMFFSSAISDGHRESRSQQ